MVNAAKNGESEKADCIRKKWYQNADEIAAFLASINPLLEGNEMERHAVQPFRND